MKTRLERTIVICPKCGEDNSDNFRFCGMCGNLLEARRPAGSPVPGLSGLPQGGARTTEPLRSPVIANATAPRQQPAPLISGPSMLGLDLASPNQPNMDSLREKSFSGLDSFFEPEQPKTGGRRILLMVALLAALGGAGWWTYQNYLGATGSLKPEAPALNTSAAPVGPSTPPVAPSAAKNAAPTPDASSTQAVAAPAPRVPEGPSENASAGPGTNQKPADIASKPSGEASPATPAAGTAATTAPAKREAKREPSTITAKAASTSAPAPADTGEVAFHKGEAYLYGRGVPENCDEAVKYLKAASAKTNAKARGAFGTMYATGHCVPRDLPTSYLWFAMALRADPTNQILEKDLSAIWNQMTPPERQLATRMKQ